MNIESMKGISANDLQTVIHEKTIDRGIMPGSDLLRDFGFSKAQDVFQAVKKLKEISAIDVTGPLLDSDATSVYKVTLAVRPAHRQYSKSLLNRR